MQSSALDWMMTIHKRLSQGDYPIEVETRPIQTTLPCWEGDLLIRVKLRNLGIRIEHSEELEAILYGTTVWIDWWAEAVLYSHVSACERYIAELPPHVYEGAANQLRHRHFGFYVEYETQEIGFGFHISALREVLDFALLQACEEGSRL